MQINRIIDKNYACTYCGTKQKPTQVAGYLICVGCWLPQLYDVVYDPKTSTSPISGLKCVGCGKLSESEKQIRATTYNFDPPRIFILWECEKCGNQNRTRDDFEILNSETVE